jgi:hypothetical protein
MSSIVKIKLLNLSKFHLSLLTFLILNTSNIVHAQENLDCISKRILMDVQRFSLDQVRSIMNNEGWVFDDAKSKQSFNYFDVDLDINYSVVSWKKHLNYHDDKIVFYYSPNRENILIYQTNLLCFNRLEKNFADMSKSTKSENDELITQYKEDSITIDFRQFTNDYANDQYSIVIFNSLDLEEEIKYLNEQAEKLKKAEEEKKIKYTKSLNQGDSLLAIKEFENAKIQYLLAQGIENNAQLKLKIDLCNNEICKELNAFGDSLLISKRYNEAQSKFEEVIEIDNINVHASEKIKEIENIKSLLKRRSIEIFSYKNTNQSDLLNFQSKLIDDLSSRINYSQNGYLNLSYLIAFDTLGINNSLVSNISSSIKEYPSFLSSSPVASTLKPAEQSGVFLAAQENVTLNANWSLYNVVFKSTSKGIFSDRFSDQNVASAEKYLKKQQLKYGEYEIEIKEKNVNGNSYSDINLVNYNTVGPEAVFLSMLMPGMGTLKVTYGEKGWGRFAWFLLSSSFALGSKFFSDRQYDNYLKATNQSDIDKYYNSANLSHKIALISGGLSATIYLTDIISVISKGSKNLKESYSMRNQLKKGPVTIQNQSISW